MTITFRRSGSGPPPTDHELLVINDDGTFEMERAFANERAGRFAGTVPTHAFSSLQDTARAIEPDTTDDSGNDDAPITPDSSTELVDVDGTTFTAGPYDEPDGARGALFATLRTLLDELTDQPKAALELDLDAAALRHAGTDPVTIDFTNAHVNASLTNADGASLGNWAGTLDGGIEQAGPGWQRDLGLADAGFEPLRPGDGRGMYVTVVVRIDGRLSRLFATAGEGWE